MKHSKITAAGLTCGLALLLGAASASADPLVIPTTPSPDSQTTFVGSDTLNEVVDGVLSGLRASSTVLQISTYTGIGSGQGQRQMEGNPNVGEPTCTPTDVNGAPELNPGCEEIAPMSSEMSSGICDDEVLSGTNSTAEELAICGDGIVLITDNASHRQFADAATACPTSADLSDNSPNYTVNAAYSVSGKLRSSGSISVAGTTTPYTIGANGMGWKDVIRLVYTGCDNSQGTCSGVDRMVRCNSAARHAVIDHWEYLQESGTLAGDTSLSNPQKDCNGATADACAVGSAGSAEGGLRAAYRRDDTSGTTKAFLTLIGIANDTTLNYTGRQKWIQGGGFATIPTTYEFCDGGQTEGFSFAGPDCAAAPGNPLCYTSNAASPFNATAGVQGDPITKPCKSEDNLCSFNKRMGVVRSIRSGEGVNVYPAYQCTSGAFDSIQFINTALPICPDGFIPDGGQCLLPYYLDTATGTKHYNCMNKVTSLPASVPVNNDGRAYNYVMKNDVTGAPELVATTLPQVAQWRQHMYTTLGGLAGGPIPAANLVCTEADATRNIGCIVGKTTCSVGWAGREAAGNNPYDDLQEPFRLMPLGGTVALAPSDSAILTTVTTDKYPFARDLYLNSIGGFENLVADCKARSGNPTGPTPQFCLDELAIANEFYNMTDLVKNACRAASFLPYDTSVCRGAQPATGCGRSNTPAPPHSDCKPN